MGAAVRSSHLPFFPPQGKHSHSSHATAWGLTHGKHLYKNLNVSPSYGLLWCEVLHRLQVNICSIMNIHGQRGNGLFHHCFCHRLQGNLHSSIWSNSSASFTDFGVCRMLFSYIVTPLLSTATVATAQGFFPFLNMLRQRHYHCCWWAQPCPAASLSWSQLAFALLDMGEASSSFSQKPTL